MSDYDGVEGYCEAAKMSGGIFSDGFEGGTTAAWSMTFTTDQSLLVWRTWTYGGRGGRVSNLETTIGEDLFSQTFAWDQLGSVTQLGYPDLAGFPEPPTALGTVTNMYTNGLLTAVEGFASSLTYHPNGAVNTVFHANSIHDVHWMDGSSMQRPARIRARRSGTFPWDPGAYQFDGAGNVTSIGAQTFTYDEGNRLVQSQADDGSEVVTQTYDYDGFGNLVSVTGPQGVRTFPADLATNRLAAAAYDAAGNLTSWGGFSYEWRPTGELRSRTGTGLNKWFAYDAGGERVVVHDRLSGRMTFTIRDHGGKVLRVFGKDAGGSWSWEKDYVYRNGLLLAAKDPAGTVHFTLDHLGTPRYVTDAAGNEVARHSYFGFGEEATSTWRDEAMKFTGHERDLEGTPDRLDDLDYMHARYYNPLLGRFLSVDPVGGKVGSSQSFKRYAYVGNSPLNLVDPFGLDEVYLDVNGQYDLSEIGFLEVIVIADAMNPRLSWAETLRIRWIQNRLRSAERQAVTEARQRAWAEEGELPRIETLSNLPGALWHFFEATGGFMIGGTAGRTGRLSTVPKAVNLSAWRRIVVDMKHISSGHMVGGSRVSSIKSLFPAEMSRDQVESAVRTAYR